MSALYVYIYIYVCICVYIYKYIYTYIYIYIYLRGRPPAWRGLSFATAMMAAQGLSQAIRALSPTCPWGECMFTRGTLFHNMFWTQSQHVLDIVSPYSGVCGRGHKHFVSIVSRLCLRACAVSEGRCHHHFGQILVIFLHILRVWTHLGCWNSEGFWGATLCRSGVYRGIGRLGRRKVQLPSCPNGGQNGTKTAQNRQNGVP